MTVAPFIALSVWAAMTVPAWLRTLSRTPCDGRTQTRWPAYAQGTE